MGAARRNLSVLLTGVAAIGAGYGFGREVAYNPEQAAEIASYEHCVSDLAVTPGNHRLPPSCLGEVVFRHPDLHHKDLTPKTILKLPAKEFKPDTSIDRKVRSQIAETRKSSEREWMIIATVAWALSAIFVRYVDNKGAKQ